MDDKVDSDCTKNELDYRAKRKVKKAKFVDCTVIVI